MRATQAASVLSIAALMVGPASAQFDLQITEMWPGNEPGENLTEDWFELTNVGDTEWTPAGGDLYFDDESSDPLEAVALLGVTSIAPGESVVFVNDETTEAFETVWGPAVDGVQLGAYPDGSGLSQGGDGVTLFVSNGAPLGDLSNVLSVDLELYPDAESNGGQSWDVVLGRFSTAGDAAGAVQSAVANDMDQYGVGSPGSVVPEPTALVLSLVAAGGVMATRRR